MNEKLQAENDRIGDPEKVTEEHKSVVIFTFVITKAVIERVEMMVAIILMLNVLLCISMNQSVSVLFVNWRKSAMDSEFKKPIQMHSTYIQRTIYF